MLIQKQAAQDTEATYSAQCFMLFRELCFAQRKHFASRFELHSDVGSALHSTLLSLRHFGHQNLTRRLRLFAQRARSCDVCLDAGAHLHHGSADGCALVLVVRLTFFFAHHTDRNLRTHITSDQSHVAKSFESYRNCKPDPECRSSSEVAGDALCRSNAWTRSRSLGATTINRPVEKGGWVVVVVGGGGGGGGSELAAYLRMPFEHG